MLVLMRVSARDADALADGPFGGAPHNPVPGHVRVVLDVLIVKLNAADAYQAHILVECQLIVIGYIPHDLIDVGILICLSEGISNDRIANSEAVWVPRAPRHG